MMELETPASAATIRLLQEKDHPGVGAILRGNGSEVRKQRITRHLEYLRRDYAKEIYLVAEIDGTIVGFGFCIQSPMDQRWYELVELEVHPDWQRKGIGKRLVAALVEQVKKRRGSLIVAKAKAEIEFPQYYQQFGFEEQGRLGPNHRLMTLAVAPLQETAA